jgi:LysM repeat protein
MNDRYCVEIEFWDERSIMVMGGLFVSAPLLVKGGVGAMRRVLQVTGAVLLLAMLAVPAVGAAPQAAQILGYHVVRPGESLFCIGRAYGVDPWAIATQNGILWPYRIYPGEVLAIPAVYRVLPAGPVCARQFDECVPACTCVAYHRVARGETLYGIAFHFGVSMWDIAECNRIFNLRYIRSGDTLCIPGR